MVVDKGNGVSGSDVQQCVVEDGSQVIARPRLACLVEVVVQGDVKERDLRNHHDGSRRKA